MKNNLHPTEKTALLFLFKHMGAGVCGGLVFGLLILYKDIGNIWTMMSNSPDGMLFLVMMFSGLFLTFGSIGMGIGIFSLGQERDEPPQDRHYY